MVFAESPLCVPVCVSEFKKGEKREREESFREFGENCSQVDGSVVVRVVFCPFFVQWCEPV